MSELTTNPCNQPATTVLTHAQPQGTTNTATNNALHPCPIMTSALALQTQHRNANVAALTLLTRDDQPTPVVHLSVTPLYRHRKQLHCPAHKCTVLIIRAAP